MEKLFKLLKEQGGQIVSSNDCTPLQIAHAGAIDRMFVDDDGFGFIYLGKEESCIKTN